MLPVCRGTIYRALLQLRECNRRLKVYSSQQIRALPKQAILLDIPQLSLIHPEIMSQFVEDCLPDLVSDLGVIGADRFDVLLVQDDVVRSSG